MREEDPNMVSIEPDEEFDIEGPNMVPLKDVIPTKYIERLPPGAADYMVNEKFKDGNIQWVEGPALMLEMPHRAFTLLVGTFEDGGIIHETMYVDEEGMLAPPEKATRGESWTYDAQGRMVMQALLGGPFTPTDDSEEEE